MRFVVYMNGNRICPKCGGEVRFRCLDCDTRYEVVDMKSEKEFILDDGEDKQ